MMNHNAWYVPIKPWANLLLSITKITWSILISLFPLPTHSVVAHLFNEEERRANIKQIDVKRGLLYHLLLLSTRVSEFVHGFCVRICMWISVNKNRSKK